MTFQPPNQGNQPPAPPPGPGQPGQFGPPPGGGYPPPGGGYPPPGGQGGPGGRPGFDPKTVNPLDWAIMGAGLLAFIFSLFDYYSASAFGYSTSESAFGDGFLGWLAALLALAGAAVIAVSLFASQVSMPAAPRLIALGLFAVAFLCSLITMFLNPTDVPDQYFSHGFGYWASFVLIVAATVLCLMRFQQTGGVLPGALGSKVPNIGDKGPAARYGGQPTPGGPASGGYGTAPSPGAGPGPAAGPGAPGPGTAGPGAGHPTPGNPGTGGQPPGSPPPPSYGPPSGS
ncbi:hypothetical protein [uncultured Jatrophihabitans sp.]|uniref:hypothetical protein n=1 Tax=uncultured Jatrophihabitans sp. TaxID=1610747 RepID=UPI0035CB6890